MRSGLRAPPDSQTAASLWFGCRLPRHYVFNLGDHSLSRYLLFLFVLLSSCAGVNSGSPKLVHFSMSGSSYGVDVSTKFYVVLDDETNESSEAKRIKNYVSYVLNYRGLNEVTNQGSADYFVIVNYVDSEKNSSEQMLQLTAVSKRVYAATGEARPRWIAVSKHFGKPSHKEKMLPMHIMSIRDFAGRNPNPHQAARGYKPNDPYVIKLMKLVEK